ncbi:MAG: hypothetical protein AAF657_23705 [Acidobacteriota bacterium]
MQQLLTTRTFLVLAIGLALLAPPVEAQATTDDDTLVTHSVDFDLDGAIDRVLLKNDGSLVLLRKEGDRFVDVSGLPDLLHRAASSKVEWDGSTKTLDELSITLKALRCAKSIRDTSAPGNCLVASSDPQIGKLYPLSTDFNLALGPFNLSTEIQTVLGSKHTELLGSAVASAGDVNRDGVHDLIIGSALANTLNAFSGLATVYSGDDGSVLHHFEGSSAFGRLGHSVAGIRDINGDGHRDLIVGEPHALTSVVAGFAYVFSGFDGSQIYQITGDGSADLFGFSVDSAGDVDDDGVHDIIIGAPIQGFTPRIGYARVHSGADGSQLLDLQGSRDDDWFGFDVAGAGDVDGDGHADVIVGAPKQSSDAGRVTVFSGATGATLHSIDGDAAGQQLGFAVDGVGDMDGDGFADFAAAGPFASPLSFVRVYSGATGAVIHNIQGVGALTAIDGAGDMTGDKVPDLLIGSPFANEGGVALFSGADASQVLEIVGQNLGDRFGSGVARVGTTIAVGATHDDTAMPDAGAVTVYPTRHVGIGTTSPGDRVEVAGVVASSTGGLRFPDDTVQDSADLTGPEGPQGPQGPEGPQGVQGPPGTGLQSINGLANQPLTIAGGNQITVSQSGSTITLNLGPTLCSEGPRTYSPGAVCYLNDPVDCGPPTFGRRNTRRTCRPDGTWLSVTSACSNPSPLMPFC